MSKVGVFRQQPTGYKAFILEKFPSHSIVQWDQDLMLLLSAADRAIGKLNAIDQLVPDVDFFIYMYVKKEAALSSQIEGTQATLLDFVKAEAKLTDEKAPSDVFGWKRQNGQTSYHFVPLQGEVVNKTSALYL